MHVLIPLAGKGSRFQDAGYTFPKPLIDVNGKPMISMVIENFALANTEAKFIFICQKEHYEKYDLPNVLQRAVGGPNFEIIQIDGITQGAACTALMAKDFIDSDEDLLIANSDQLIQPDVMYEWFDHIKNSKKDGEIMCFKSSHPKWSYARLDENKNVVEIAEKKVISEWATTGIYWWKHGKDFVKSVEDMIEKDIRTNDEFYIAPSYNELILNGLNIGIKEIKNTAFHGIGTPEDLQTFLSLQNG